MQQTKIVLALSLLLGAAVAHAQVTSPVAVSPAAPGQPALATSDWAIAVGNNAGAGTTQAGGFPALLIAPLWSYVNQISIGNSSIAWGAGDIAIGAGTVAASQPVPGVTSSATAIGTNSAAWGTNNTALGFRALSGATSSGAPTSNPTISNATAVGGQSNASANNSTAVGATANAVATNATAIGNGSTAMGTNSVALGAGTVATQANTVAVGSRRLVGLADGTAANDAVNLGQLQAALAGYSGGGIDAGAILNQANSYTDQAINSLRREYSRAIASVAAAPSLPALAQGERAIAVGTGFYNGQQAIGVSIAQAMNNGAMLNAGISSAGDKPVVRAGAAWKF